jgi:hypothetical protein
MEAHLADVASPLIVCFGSLHVSRFRFREHEIARECAERLSDSDKEGRHGRADRLDSLSTQPLFLEEVLDSKEVAD